MHGSNDPITVLCVDDDPDFVDLTAEFLERVGNNLECVPTTGAQNGLELLSERNLDCIVSDYEMPGQNGIEFLQTVRQVKPNIPFILFTGKGSEEIASEAISAGVTDYLQKSASTEDYQLLANRIRAAVEQVRSVTNYREVFEKSPDGIVIHDVEDGSFVDMNQKYAEMFGYTKEEFLDAGFEVIHPGEAPYTIERAGEEVEKAVREGAHTFEWLAVRKDGSQFWSEVHLTPVTLHGQDRILAAVRDISERREYWERLKRQNERLEEFASIVSHDLRNPLSLAHGRVNLAREEYESEHLDEAHRALERMRSLIEDLLTLARNGAPDPELGAVDLLSLSEECWQAVEINDATLEVSTNLSITADDARLKRLLENLFRNSMEHSEAPVTVTVGESDEGFFVADDGPGIPEDQRETVFEPGYSTDPEGTGYGLKIVREIAEAHDWEITLTESESGGARFEFAGVFDPK